MAITIRAKKEIAKITQPTFIARSITTSRVPGISRRMTMPTRSPRSGEGFLFPASLFDVLISAYPPRRTGVDAAADLLQK
ncbi:hypothetical protein ACWD69_06560 [Micromonospora chokoriensis]